MGAHAGNYQMRIGDQRKKNQRLVRSGWKCYECDVFHFPEVGVIYSTRGYQETRTTPLTIARVKRGMSRQGGGAYMYVQLTEASTVKANFRRYQPAL